MYLHLSTCTVSTCTCINLHMYMCVHVHKSTISICTYTSPVTSCRYQGWVKRCKKKELKHKLKPLKFCQPQAQAPAHLIWIGLKFMLKPLVKRVKSEIKPFLWTIGNKHLFTRNNITIRSYEHQLFKSWVT